MSLSKLFSDMKRVWKVTKKPSKKDYFQTLKIVLIGLLIIGVVALTFEFVNQFLIQPLFS